MEVKYIEEKYFKSPLNYVGGKFKLLPQIIKLFPDNIDTFVDLFGGGFNVGSNVKSDKILYNDLCKPVMGILEYLYSTDTNACIRDIENYIKEYGLSKENKQGFEQIRADYNKLDFKPPLMLYTIICYAFNNQVRFNSKGEYNMPFGKNRSSFNPTLKQKFIEFCDNIHSKNCRFMTFDFRRFFGAKFNNNDFVYCDPPYFNSTAAYNEQNGWTEKDEYDLLNMLVNLNVKWALSNNLKTNPRLKEWADKNKFTVHYLDGSYGNCNYHKKDKSKDIEVLITNY